MPKQVRLDDDVADALTELRMPGSMSKATNEVLRAALDLNPKIKRKRRALGTADPRLIPDQITLAPPPVVMPPAIPPVMPGVIERPRATRDRGTPVRQGACRHPITRRIGRLCGACGVPVR